MLNVRMTVNTGRGNVPRSWRVSAIWTWQECKMEASECTWERKDVGDAFILKSGHKEVGRLDVAPQERHVHPILYKQATLYGCTS